MQSNWIGKSVGAEIDFKIKNKPDSKLKYLRQDQIQSMGQHSLQYRQTQNNSELSLNNKSMKKFIEECRNINPDKIKKGVKYKICLQNTHLLKIKNYSNIYSKFCFD